MNLLLTSAGRRGYLVNYFKEALGDGGEVHVANSVNSTAMMYGDKSVITPLIYDENYIPFLKNYCLVNHIEAIIPLFDIDLPILTNNIKVFKDIGVNVIVSNKEIINICNDKWETYKFLITNDFQTPKTFLKVSDALNAIEQGNINFPLIIKPRWGMGSISIFDADNSNELEVLFEKVKKDIQDSLLLYESNQENQLSVLIQEKLSGQEYGLDIINDLNGKYMNTIVKKKYAMRSGETDIAETSKDEALELVGKSLATFTNHIGNLDVDAFVVDGVSYILEMNARIGGGYPFSHYAGVNLPKAIVSWLKQEKVDPAILKAKIGVIGYKDIQIIGEDPVSSMQKYEEAIPL
ncbi:ATP-grasp domain-containing protein [Psychrobacillus sp. FSL H8-0510]|uniref:ATP-grasp domain-containing protein n=1 Tax=Psychrobacillus sp. FSL H8-0510 TaxID=2921394 RepID=UPI0030FB882E